MSAAAIQTGPIEDSKIRAMIVAINDQYSKWKGSSVNWVNWRKDSCQIKVVYDDTVSFALFLDFKYKDASKGVPFAHRDNVLRLLHGRHSTVAPCRLMRDEPSFAFREHDVFVAPSEMYELATQVCGDEVELSFFYIQECTGSRKHFVELGRALVPGECGLKWSAGQLTGHCIEGDRFL